MGVGRAPGWGAGGADESIVVVAGTYREVGVGAGLEVSAV